MSPQTKLCAVLRGVLEDAVRIVPEAKRTSSLKACLAQTILTLAAGGELDPAILTRLAVRTVQESCRHCYGCEGWQPTRAAVCDDWAVPQRRVRQA